MTEQDKGTGIHFNTLVMRFPNKHPGIVTSFPDVIITDEDFKAALDEMAPDTISKLNTLIAIGLLQEDEILPSALDVEAEEIIRQWFLESVPEELEEEDASQFYLRSFEIAMHRLLLEQEQRPLTAIDIKRICWMSLAIIGENNFHTENPRNNPDLWEETTVSGILKRPYKTSITLIDGYREETLPSVNEKLASIQEKLIQFQGIAKALGDKLESKIPSYQAAADALRDFLKTGRHPIGREDLLAIEDTSELSRTEMKMRASLMKLMNDPNIWILYQNEFPLPFLETKIRFDKMLVDILKSVEVAEETTASLKDDDNGEAYRKLEIAHISTFNFFLTLVKNYGITTHEVEDIYKYMFKKEGLGVGVLLKKHPNASIRNHVSGVLAEIRTAFKYIDDGYEVENMNPKDSSKAEANGEDIRATRDGVSYSIQVKGVGRVPRKNTFFLNDQEDEKELREWIKTQPTERRKNYSNTIGSLKEHARKQGTIPVWVLESSLM